MMLKYYRTNHPEVISAYQAFQSARSKLLKEAKLFASQFPISKPVFESNYITIRLTGLKFEPALSSPLWTKPDKRSGAQRPRSTVPKRYQEESAVLIEQWNDGYPATNAEYEPFWNSIGTNWGNLLFTGIRFFMGVDSNIYIQTAAQLNKDRVTEVLGSEYARASQVDIEEQIERGADHE